MKILNLGSGFRASPKENVINIDWSIYLRIRRNFILKFLSPLFLSKERYKNLINMPKNIMVYNLSKGIPFEDNSVDVVYHSHLIEHLDKDVAKKFLIEIKRVLKPGGIIRISTPDFERYCRDYIKHYDEVTKGKSDKKNHEKFFERILEQSVRREAAGAKKQNKILRFIENLLLGDARKRGETHQWMYDKISLSHLLEIIGFENVKSKNFDQSSITDWNQYFLDCNEDFSEYKPESMYIEATK